MRNPVDVTRLSSAFGVVLGRANHSRLSETRSDKDLGGLEMAFAARDRLDPPTRLASAEDPQLEMTVTLLRVDREDELPIP